MMLKAFMSSLERQIKLKRQGKLIDLIFYFDSLFNGQFSILIDLPDPDNF